eukprot:CAMPEP_0201579816 /NCGR_PEP_ID=MMETSP0190_2-20130828/27691_1 /ASSEMBLY_ACC=CAM_ASM_000263 /TAXON_ID=37353 /ORGANISM="Rosalina sp." /LENGTH=292 /DNA_ID=CAMNT_0048014815 /DNA_START=109 /DNA_END=987 /DNA_ORIENTATION=+
MISIIIGSLFAYATYSQGQTVADVIASRPELSTLYGALQTAGLVSVLNDTKNVLTVLAPVNDAFKGVVVPNQVPVLQNLLEYHVVAGKVPSSALKEAEVVPTLIKQTVTVALREQEQEVFFFDSNGRRGKVIKANLEASNGIVHEIDNVLLPNGTLANITANIPALSALNGALVSTGLDKVLADPTQNLTLFAPTNESVADFKGTINQNLLLYHVVDAEIFSTDLKQGDNVVPTLDQDKDEIDVIANQTGVYVEDKEKREGRVIQANIAGVNGVVHVINIVLSPVPVPSEAE